VIASNNTSVTINTNNVQRMVVGAAGGAGLAEIGIAQQPMAGVTLAVSGTVRAASSHAGACTSTTFGAMRYNTVTGKPEICRPQ